MSGAPDLLPPDDLADEDESVVEDRRRLVHRLTLRGQSPKAIAAIVGNVLGMVVAQATVHADLEWLKEHATRLYGATGGALRGQAIAGAIETYQALEEVGWREYHACDSQASAKRLSPMYMARVKQGWAKSIALYRTLQVKTLSEFQLMEPVAQPTLVGAGSTAGVPRADEIRALLRKEGLLTDGGLNDVTRPRVMDDAPLIPDPLEEAMVDPIARAIDQWADDGGLAT